MKERCSLKTALLAIFLIGLVILFVIVAIAAAILKKGARFLFGSRHRHYSSSGWKNPGHFGGHHSYGHGHYRHKHSSHSFFSS
jgi:hypothetical protein